MEVEKFRGYVAAITAFLGVIGGTVGAAWAFHFVATSPEPRPDAALILSVFTSIIGASTTFLFVQDSSARASAAASRSFASGAQAGSTIPEQASTLPSGPRVGVPTEADAPQPPVADAVAPSVPE